MLGAFNNVVGTSFFPRYLEPFAPERIVEVGPGPKRLLTDPDVEDAGGQRAQDPRHQRVRPRGRGHRLRVRRRPGDDQRPRRGRRRRPRGDHRRQLGRRPRSSTTTPTSTSPCWRPTRRACPSCRFDDTAGAEDGVAILGYPQDGPYDVQPGRIRSEQRLRSPEHLRRGHGHPRGVLAARAGPAGQLRRPDRVVGGRRGRAWCSRRR